MSGRGGRSTDSRGDGRGEYRNTVQATGKRPYPSAPMTFGKQARYGGWEQEEEEQEDCNLQEGQQQDTYNEDYNQDHMASMAQAQQVDRHQQRCGQRNGKSIAHQEDFEWGEFQPHL